MSTTYQLSLEELAFGMAFLGSAELAAGFLKMSVGDLHPDNLTGRLTAASHSLIAHGLLRLDLTSNTNTLEPELAQAIHTMMASAHSVRCNSGDTRGQEEERVVTFFLHNGAVTVNQITQGVVARLEMLDPALLASGLTAFVGAGPQTGGSATSLGILSTDTLQRVRQEVGERPLDAIAARMAGDLPAEVAREIATDLAAPDITWGSILYLYTPAEDETPTGDGAGPNLGLLYAAAPDRLWLFHIEPSNTAIAQVYRGDQQVLQELCERLLPDDR